MPKLNLRLNFNPDSASSSMRVAVLQLSISIVGTLFYYYLKNVSAGDIPFQFATMTFLIFGMSVVFYNSSLLGRKWNLKRWQILAVLSVFALVFNYEAASHAQVLGGVESALEEVGTAAGNAIAVNIITAVVTLLRIIFYTTIIGAGVAAVVLGVMQGQWQGPVLFGMVVFGIGLFMELMGIAVFGGGNASFGPGG